MSLVQIPDAVAAPAVEAPVVDAPVVAPVVAPVTADPAVALAPSAPLAVAPPVRPEGLPDSFWDAATGVKTPEVLARLTELETADASRRAELPADAAGYKLEPAEPIIDPVSKLPVTFNADDPLAKGALAWAHENGVSQPAVSKLLSLFAQSEMAGMAATTARVNAEIEKLGAGSDARFAAVNAGLVQHAGAEGAKALMASLGSAAAVEALEKVLKATGGPSIGSPPAVAKASQFEGLSGVDLLSAIRAQK